MYGLLQCTSLLSKAMTVGGHAALAAWLWVRSLSVDARKRQELASHYMYIWRLFYLEYLLIPFLS